jgi:hypothetical protein
VQGLIAARAGGDTVSRARGYLVRLQRRDGSVAYSSGSAQTPVWVTAQALMALRGKPLPLPTVARAKRARAGAAAAGGSGGSDGVAASGGAGTAGGAAAGGGADGAGGAAAEAGGFAGVDATGEATDGTAGLEPEGTTAAALADDATTTAAGSTEEVPLWAGILAALVLLGLLWVLHRFVLPRRADVG